MARGRVWTDGGRSVCAYQGDSSVTVHTFKIGGREIGIDRRPYIIAELSGNHNGKIERAFALMDMAKRKGADAVKLQTYTADTMTIDHQGPGFQIEGGLW